MSNSDRHKFDSTEPQTTAEPARPNIMKKWFSKNKTDPTEVNKEDQSEVVSQVSPSATQPDVKPETPNLTETTVDQGLESSRKGLLAKIGDVFKGSFDLNDELFDELEEILITSDIGLNASLKLINELRERVKKEKIQSADGVIAGLAQGIAEVLGAAEADWAQNASPYVILIVGVNGVGKTTTTAKIANHFKQNGKSVMLAAADTFRAAAVEQLQEWGQRLSIPVIAQANGADAAAVAHDALSAAKAKQIDVLIIDTAGRLHTQSNLMEQLQKVSRVLKKIDDQTPHEVIQVLDAGTGQNALSQLEHFQKAAQVSSLCVTKLDGSAKGGVIIALSEKFGLPIRFIGIGEGINDLKPFNAYEFASALLTDVHKK